MNFNFLSLNVYNRMNIYACIIKTQVPHEVKNQCVIAKTSKRLRFCSYFLNFVIVSL